MSNSNTLLDPISELSTVLEHNAFGLSPDKALTEIILEGSYPITPEEKTAAATAARSGRQGRSQGEGNGEEKKRVRASARIGLIEGGVGIVILDQRGYTVSYRVCDSGSGTGPGSGWHLILVPSAWKRGMARI